MCLDGTFVLLDLNWMSDPSIYLCRVRASECHRSYYVQLGNIRDCRGHHKYSRLLLPMMAYNIMGELRALMLPVNVQ